MKKLILTFILIAGILFPQTRSSKYILNDVYDGTGRALGAMWSEQALYNAVWDNVNGALRFTTVGGEFQLTSDLDTIKFDAGFELYMIDIEVDNSRIFSLDSTGNVIAVGTVAGSNLSGTNTGDDSGTDDQTIDVSTLVGNTITLSLEDDGEASKTFDISTTTAVTANSAKIGVTTEISDVVDDTTPQLGGDLDLTDYEILLDSTPDTDHTASGMKVIFTAGETVNFGDVVYLLTADSEMYLADATDETKLPGAYMALETIIDGNTGEFLKMGLVRDDTWTWTVGDYIYISLIGTTGNTLTQTAPAVAGEVVQKAGLATHADRMDFSPAWTIVVN